MLILYKNDRNVRFVLFKKTSSVVSLWMNVIGTFWWATTGELIHIVWLEQLKKLSQT